MAGFGRPWVAALLAIVLRSVALAAPPAAPGEVTYQGLLLDGAGEPRTGTVDLTLRVFDALNGGTLLYTQVFLAVPLTDGVFSVSLGPTGTGSDVPEHPLTTSLVDALTGDLGATGDFRFLEVSVGSETALTRTQILSVPYALYATTAEQAATAGDADAVGGLDSLFVTQLYEQTNLDSQDPPNNDPQEGLADVDGDGASNFIDPDNDDDGLLDGTELANGTALNLITPTLADVSPTLGDADLSQTVTLVGTNFEPGITVDFGEQSPAPLNSTPTELEVVVGPQAPAVVDVTVTRANGESATLGSAFEFAKIGQPHPVAPVGQLSLGVKGTQQTILGTQVEYGVDANADLVPETVLPFPTRTIIGQLAVAWGTGGAATGLRCRDAGVTNECTVELAVDSDADFELDDEAGTAIETVNGPGARLESPSLAFDLSGNVGAGYVTTAVGSVTASVAHDRDGNGDFLGPNERVSIETLAGVNATVGEVAFDPSGRVVYVYRKDLDVLRVAYDRSGDGDFDDTVGGNPELFDLASGGGGSFTCVGASFDSAGGLAIAYGGSGNPLRLARDLDRDGDLGGPGEIVMLTSSDVLACDVIGGAGLGLAVAHDQGPRVRLRVDRNDDGDFLGANEDLSIVLPTPSNAVETRRNGAGQVVLATDSAVFRDVIP